ncbi:MAG TPA: redox-sensitive transcriptional activator SoxR [Acinetobacter ursingii]|nr:redox-sensitive transcriptional activator SoxR [Acinetobacter ursingii]MCH2005625.1 redox-sensitive transcriptional activator SoxR [Acinetobacter ursingii]MCU4305571.1 redox-sensitive transcriptional activator SoxR [Acinetobacter ursingii]MCU4371690.1 redox-sensitive transcriptional activator SoxR [Acinetobacter ursingii]MCU4608515.1 redox-sensitive transcriptional activator SoxR [Acinetobacter ursingii]MDG9992420.1 redox-sensitive transcriptional activator SoxR [Acinetobacter ursingii]
MQNNHLKQFISIGELAKRSGVSVATLRFYEEKQLIWSVRTNGNQRRYLRAMLRRVAIIKIAQVVGIRLEEVKQAFSVLPQEQIAAKQDWQNMSKLWKEQLDNKILTLLQLRQQLDWCIGCGCLSMDQCPLRNPDDYLAQESSGAHFQQVLLALDRLDQTET